MRIINTKFIFKLVLLFFILLFLTSKPVKAGVISEDIITIDDFIEYNFGEFEQCTADDLKDNEDFKNWIGGDIYAKTPYGESNAEFAQRICAAFEKVIDGCIKTGTQNIAIVGHAGVLMTLLSCYGLPEAPMAHWQMDPGYGFKLRITPSLWMRANKIEVIDTSPESMQSVVNK